STDGYRRQRRAVGDDARSQAHIRRPDREARARRANPRRGALEPDLPRAVERRGRLAGIHGDGEALRAAPGGALRPARARHAAVAQCARLPGGARTPLALRRLALTAAVPASGQARPEGVRTRHRDALLGVAEG